MPKKKCVVLQMYCASHNVAPMTFGPVSKATQVEGCTIFDGDHAVNVYCKLPTVKTLRHGESMVFDAGALTLLTDRNKNVVRGVVDASKVRIVPCR